MNQSLLKSTILGVLFLLTHIALPTSLSAAQKVENFNTKNPSLFYPNKGQIIDQNRKVRKDVNYHYSAPGFALSLTQTGMSWTLSNREVFKKKSRALSPTQHMADKAKELDSFIFHTHRMDIEFVNCNTDIRSEVSQTSDYYQNFYTEFTGEKGITEVHGSKQVTLKNVWNNIDIVFNAKEQGKVEYDFIVHPKGNIKDIQLKYKSDGVGQNLVSSTKILYKTSIGEVEESIPMSYYAISKRSVQVGYLQNDGIISYSIKENGINMAAENLIIDPQLVWSTYYGGVVMTMEMGLQLI